MFFDEARSLNQLHYRKFRVCNQADFATRHSTSQPKDNQGSLHFPASNKAPQPATPATTPEMLDSANNRLQELMQILYLLSRDPAVPNDARHHVTVAQSEIALLAREIRNTTEPQAESASPSPKTFGAAQP